MFPANNGRDTFLKLACNQQAYGGSMKIYESIGRRTLALAVVRDRGLAGDTSICCGSQHVEINRKYKFLDVAKLPVAVLGMRTVAAAGVMFLSAISIQHSVCCSSLPFKEVHSVTYLML